MMRWCGSRRISPCAIRSWTGRAISAISTAITPPPCAYTEARMTEVATLLLEGINENAIDFRPTYNEEDEEPIVLPGAFPNLLANGSAGIAVGMATNIPPHNVAELCSSALYLINHPDAPVEELVTSPEQWAEIEQESKTDPAALLKCKVRGRISRPGASSSKSMAIFLRPIARGAAHFAFPVPAGTRKRAIRGTWVIVVTEIPYQVQKSRLIEKIMELLLAKKAAAA